MREYGKVLPAFWTKGSGKRLRGDPTAQLVALYLFTCPSATMTGLYYLPVPILAHETGLPLEGALKALQRVCEAGIASYDQENELVWVPEMARIQIGSSLAPRDLRIKGVEREIQAYRGHPFFGLFVAKYREAYCLTEPAPNLDSSKPPRSPLEAPYRPLGSQEQDQEQDHDQIPPVCVDQGSGNNARAETPSDIHTHTGRGEGFGEAPCPPVDLPPIPDAAWLAAELSKYPAVARFAADEELMLDLAAGFQVRARTCEQAAVVIADFVTKVGGEARRMNRDEVQQRLGGFIANVRLAGSRGVAPIDPTHPGIREALRIFDEVWSKARGAPRAPGDGDAEEAAKCVALAKATSTKGSGKARASDVFRQAATVYLADASPKLVDAQWALRLLRARWDSYAQVPQAGVSERGPKTGAKREPPVDREANAAAAKAVLNKIVGSSPARAKVTTDTGLEASDGHTAESQS